MGNLFDSTYYPSQEPASLVVGDRWAWKRTDLHADYPVDSYTLSYELILEGTGTTSITITCSGSGTEYLAEVSAATTAGYTAGNYRWQAFITRDSDSERIRVAYGFIEIRPDFATSTADPRSHAKIVLDAIEAVLEGRATQDQMSVQHNGRRLDYTPIQDLIALRNYYKAEVAAEQAKLLADQGRGTSGMILFRFR